MHSFQNRVSDRIAGLTTKALHVTATALGRADPTLPKPRHTPVRVIHITPAHFGAGGIYGGGERYAVELARAMSELADTTLVTFGEKRHTLHENNLRIEVYRAARYVNGVPFDPLSYGYLPQLLRGDIIHCHQIKTMTTINAIVAGAILRRRVFVTDLGGGPSRLADGIDVGAYIYGHLAISGFAARATRIGKRSSVIYGGVDEPNDVMHRNVRRAVLFVGRLLPHKGIDYLIEAVPPNVPLRIVGRAYDLNYIEDLQRLSRHKNVTFITDATDADILQEYRQAFVTVLPSVYEDRYGNKYDRPELLGLVLLESMVNGTPVICTDVGGMPEFVTQGVTGFVVPPNDPVALRERILYFLEYPDAVERFGRQGRENVLRQYTWRHVAERCLHAYMGG